MSSVRKWVVEAEQLSITGIGRPWRVVSKYSRDAIDLFDRHYSRQTPGGEVGPPGRKLVLVTESGKALWCSHYPNPKLAMDKLDSFRCVVFRNEGDLISSFLIKQAVRATEEVWGPPPKDGWVTWVDTRKVESRNPGYCFKQAGWWLDRDWKHRQGNLVRLRFP